MIEFSIGGAAGQDDMLQALLPAYGELKRLEQEFRSELEYLSPAHQSR